MSNHVSLRHFCYLTLSLCALLLASTSYASQIRQFHQARNITPATSTPNPESGAHQLIRVAAPKLDTQTGTLTSHYQQSYHGIPVVGGEINIHQFKHKKRHPRYVNGQLIKQIRLAKHSLRQLNNPARLASATSHTKQAFESAYAAKQGQSHWQYQHEKARLVIGYANGQALPLYEVSFYGINQAQKPVHIVSYVDAKHPTHIVKTWNDIKQFQDTGQGGNRLTGAYYYGESGLPTLEVMRQKSTCVMDSNNVTVVDMRKAFKRFDRGNKKEPSNQDIWRIMMFKTPYQYQCGDMQRDATPFYGAYSPANDVYFFGQLVTQMYQEWYGDNVTPRKLVMRVHMRDPSEPDNPQFANAFWDDITQTTNFGDGDDMLYPLVTPDIVAHELSHGYTSYHANMAYHDESGSLNEAFSDMASVAALDYMRQTYPELYLRIYGNLALDWQVGSKTSINGKPLRYMDHPSMDHRSADCYEMIPGCQISYGDVVRKASQDPFFGQGYIVHTGSGVFNHAFYELSHQPGWNVRQAFEVMLTANRNGFWTRGGVSQENYMNNAACGAIKAADSLGYNSNDVYDAMQKAGLLLNYSCAE